MGEDERPPCAFSGFWLDKTDDGALILDQTRYLRKLEKLSNDADFANFRSMRMNLAWLSSSRADCMFEASQLAQVVAERFKEGKQRVIKMMNKAVDNALRSSAPISFKKLHASSLQIIGHSNASFASNADLASQLGQVAFIEDKRSSAAPIIFKSRKSKRVARSAMAAEAIAFSNMFDAALALRQEAQLFCWKTCATSSARR